MIIGDFDTSAFGTVAVPVAWILFVMCTIFGSIVMLNLLIAIISDTFSRVTENADQAAYQEMAKLIDENQYLIPIKVRASYVLQNKYLVIVKDLEKDDGN